MTVTITYKNGTRLTESVHYVTSDEENLIYAVNRNPTDAVVLPCMIPLRNINAYTVDRVNESDVNVYVLEEAKS